MNTTSCSVPPRQPKMFSSTPSSRTSVSSWPISSPNSRRTVSSAYSPNSTCPPSGRWNSGSSESGSETSSAPSRGRLMTAIALIICRLSVTAATGPSYHGPRAPGRAYCFVTYTIEPGGRQSRVHSCGEHEGGVTAPAVLVRDRRGGTSDRLGIHSPRLVPDRVQLDSDHRPAVPAADNLGLPAGHRDSRRPATGWRTRRARRSRSGPSAGTCCRSRSDCSASPRCGRPRASSPRSSMWPSSRYSAAAWCPAWTWAAGCWQPSAPCRSSRSR